MLNTCLAALAIMGPAAPREQVLVDTSLAIATISKDDIVGGSSSLAGFDLKNLPTPSQATGAYSGALRGLQSHGALAGLNADNIVRDAFGGPITLRGIDLNRVEVLRGPQGTLFGNNLGFGVQGGAGTICIPTRGEVQPMVLVAPFRISTWGDAEDLFLSLDEFQSGGIRALCGAMKKAEPDRAVSFIPVPCKDPVVVELAKITEASRFRGPWDQARLWIYTDRATLAEVNQRLAPEVSAARYVNGLHDVFEAQGLGDKDLENAKLFDPTFVWVDTESSAWFCRIMSVNQPKNLAKELSSNTPAAKAFFKAGQEPGKAHLAKVVPVLLASVDDDVLVGTLTFLTKVVPQANLAWVTNLGAVTELKSSKNPKVAKLANEVAKRYSL